MRDSSNKPIMIKVSDVFKDFKLPHEKSNSVKSLITNPIRKSTTETQHALKGVSFSVKQGEFFGIIGRNGCGKSTLLKMIAGIYQPTKGTIAVNGKISPFLELGVGFNPELTGRENVFLNGALLGFSKKEMQKRYKEIVDFAELHDFMDQKLINYSSGMQVRLAFSVAIQARAEILLIDEVLAVGDAAFQQKCFDYFLKLKNEGQTIIFVSHDMSSIRRFCTRALLLDKGKIKIIGSPGEAADSYRQLNNLSQEKVGQEKSETKLAEITSVKLLNNKNIDVQEINTGDTIKIIVSYKSTKNIKIINFAVGLRTQDDYLMFGYTTEADNFVPDNKGTICLTIPSLKLLEGLYYINVILYEKDVNKFVDFWERAKVFVVHATEQTAAQKGVVYFEHEWRKANV